MKMINCTPHEVNANGVTFPPSGTVARVTTTCQPVTELSGVPVVQTCFGEIVGLPEPKLGCIHIVSSMVLLALKGTRHDVIAPDTSPASVIRNDAGQIIGVKRFTL